MKYIEWDDPGPGGTVEHHSISVDEAIQTAKKVAARRYHVYDNDDDALWDFLSVHWARVIEG